MEIKTYGRVEFRLEQDQKTFSFFVPHGCSINHSIVAANDFLTGLKKLKKEHEEKKEEKEIVDDNLVSN